MLQSEKQSLGLQPEDILRLFDTRGMHGLPVLVSTDFGGNFVKHLLMGQHVGCHVGLGIRL